MTVPSQKEWLNVLGGHWLFDNFQPGAAAPVASSRKVWYTCVRPRGKGPFESLCPGKHKLTTESLESYTAESWTGVQGTLIRDVIA